MTTEKVVCQECDWQGTERELLTAPNPFLPEEKINGCPECRSVESMVYVCEHEGCWKEVSCGTPIAGGYAQTCGAHKP